MCINRTGGGAFVFINSKHKFINRTDLNINTTDCDRVFIEIPDRNKVVGIVYKPDYVDYEDFISEPEIAIDTITKGKEKKRGFIMDDFDIDLLKYDHNHQVNTFCQPRVFLFFLSFRVSIGLLKFVKLKMALPSR